MGCVHSSRGGSEQCFGSFLGTTAILRAPEHDCITPSANGKRKEDKRNRKQKSGETQFQKSVTYPVLEAGAEERLSGRRVTETFPACWQSSISSLVRSCPVPYGTRGNFPPVRLPNMSLFLLRAIASGPILFPGSEVAVITSPCAGSHGWYARDRANMQLLGGVFVAGTAENNMTPHRGI